MTIKKITTILFFLLFLLTYETPSPSFAPTLENKKSTRNNNFEKQQSNNNCADNNATALALISSKNKEDEKLRLKIQPLFFEANSKKKHEKQQKVQNVLIEKYGAKKIKLNTEDNYTISALYLKRNNAPLNIIFITGYFEDLTPTKEWCAPFAEIFPNFNLLMFDWRGFGESIQEGKNKIFRKSPFGSKAYKDILAAIKFIKNENTKPIILHGFCFGGAMALRTTIKAKQKNLPMPDGLSLSCIFNKFGKLAKRAHKSISKKEWNVKRLFGTLLIKMGLGKFLINRSTSGSLFKVNPEQMIGQIDIPIFFDHWVYDAFATLQNAFPIFTSAKNNKFILLSTEGKHVRIHTAVPHQYRQCYEQFWRKIFIPNQ